MTPLENWKDRELVSVRDNILFINTLPSNLESASLKSLTECLFQLSDVYSYVAFDGNCESDVGVILFCGFNERFLTLRLLENTNVNCLVVQDSVAPWYTGSTMCRGVDQVKEVAENKFPSVSRWLLIGQSSGGYAALRLSRMLDRSCALAFAPQCFDDFALKGSSIHFPPNFRCSRTLNVGSNVQDLRLIFFEAPPLEWSRVYIVSAFSEHENPPSEWFWIDAMHWGRLVDHPDVTVFITGGGFHSVLFQSVHRYSRLMRKIIDLQEFRHDAVVKLIEECVYLDEASL